MEEDRTIQILMMLIKSVICDKETDITEYFSLSDEEQRRIWDLAEKHAIIPIIVEALVNYNKKNQINTEEQLKKIAMISVYTYEKLQAEINNISKVLEKEKIPYIKLKGSRVRKYYPQPWLRTSCDIDILIHEEDVDYAVNMLIERLGYRKQKKNYHDILLFAPNGTCLELHFSIKEKTDTIDQVLEKVWENSSLLNDNKESFEYEQSSEFFIFHLLAHMSHHFQRGGCGIRSIIDLYLLRKKMKYKEEKVKRLCKEAHISTFYEYVVQLSKVWFDDQPHNQITKSMERFILDGETYGTKENIMRIQHIKKGGHFRYIYSRIFVSYEYLQEEYPVLQKYRWLMPFYQIVRWCSVVRKRKIKQYIQEYESSKNVSEREIKETQQLLKKLN